jgi:hypothetical protein
MPDFDLNSVSNGASFNRIDLGDTLRNAVSRERDVGTFAEQQLNNRLVSSRQTPLSWQDTTVFCGKIKGLALPYTSFWVNGIDIGIVNQRDDRWDTAVHCT